MPGARQRRSPQAGGLSDQLRQQLLRERRDRSWNQLASRTGIDRSILIRWLAGSRHPSADTMDRAFEFLVSTGWRPLRNPVSGATTSSSDPLAP